MKIEKIQERALRYIHNDYVSSYSSLLELSSMLPMYFTRMKNLVTEIYKMLNGICPAYLENMFVKKPLCYDYRKSNILDVPKYKYKKYGYNSLKYYGSVWWNKIDNSICQSASVKEFRIRIRA